MLAHFASFAALVRQRGEPCPTSQLEQWTAQAIDRGAPELKAFATKLRQDWNAVLAALTLPYSQWQTEGQVNRLKYVIWDDLECSATSTGDYPLREDDSLKRCSAA